MQLLEALRDGDAAAGDLLFQRLYPELRSIAHHRLRQFRPGETLSTTALVHEAYLRLVDQTTASLRDRAHFLAIASRAMRFIIVDYARARTADKRGGHAAMIPLDAIEIVADERAADLLELDEALRRLEQWDPRLAAVVEHRFFGGLTHEQIAEVIGMSVPTVKRDWQRARAWLYRTMQEESQQQSTT